MTNISTSKIIEWYIKHELTTTEIGRRVGLTHQAVSARLRGAGVTTRPRGRKPPVIEKNLLEKLYVQDGLTVTAVAEKLNTTRRAIVRFMEMYGIERRRTGATLVKFPELRKLEIGESVDLPRSNWLKPHLHFYDMAKNAGTRVSVKSLDAQTMRVTRVA